MSPTPLSERQSGGQGYLVLPAALDGELCRRARDHMWSVLSAEVPRLRRADPQTWGPIEPDEPTGASRLPGASEAYFTGGGHRFHVKCACEALFLELFPRVLWTVTWRSSCSERGSWSCRRSRTPTASAQGERAPQALPPSC